METLNDTTLLDHLNHTLKAMGSTVHYDSLPNANDYEALRGLRVTIVDDSMAIMERFLDLLTTATRTHVNSVLYKGETLEELKKIMISYPADIALLDYYIDSSQGIVGPLLIDDIKKKMPECLCIGFSSSREKEDVFRISGADGFVLKDGYHAEETMRNVCGLVVRS